MAKTKADKTLSDAQKARIRELALSLPETDEPMTDRIIRRWGLQNYSRASITAQIAVARRNRQD